ncbi:MAG TPA: DUF4956 domain-containing protein [Gemmatimonadaceae bacterium]|nr:DUF4956 domain-containing protein [Gemmatimonadaceae bacterium]
MRSLNQIIDFMTLGSERPIRRLLAYYAFLGLVLAGLIFLFPAADNLLIGRGEVNRPAATDVSGTGPNVLQDALEAEKTSPATFTEKAFGAGSLAYMALTTTLILIGTILLMLPVSWVYMSARHVPGHSQAVVQTLIILPLVVAGIVLIVRDSLALAFSLAGVVAAVRFRTNLRDTRDVVFIFLSIAVGFAAGVQTLAVGAVLTIVFNLLMLFTWRYDYGRNVLTPTAASQWAGPLNSLVTKTDWQAVPDRDLVLALTPDKADALAERFERVSEVLGTNKKKPRYNAVLTITSDKVTEAQALAEKVLSEQAKRWKLDEVEQHTGKPSELYYLVRLKKSVTRDEFLTALRENAGDKIATADLESREAIQEEVSVSA